MVNIQNSQKMVVNERWLHETTMNVLRFLEYDHFDLSILLVDDQEMQKYNKQFRRIDKPTDVLSFPFFTDAQPGKKLTPLTQEERILGDIIMAPLYIKENLYIWQDTFEHRLLVLLVHSICHLLGYDHINDADFVVMDAEEKRILQHIESITR